MRSAASRVRRAADRRWNMYITSCCPSPDPATRMDVRGRSHMFNDAFRNPVVSCGLVSGGSARSGRPGPGLRFRPVDDVAQLRPGLVALVRRVVPPWLRDQAEDIAHSAIAQVIERGNPDRAPSYLMRAAHNAAIDEIRRRIR